MELDFSESPEMVIEGVGGIASTVTVAESDAWQPLAAMLTT